MAETWVGESPLGASPKSPALRAAERIAEIHSMRPMIVPRGTVETDTLAAIIAEEYAPIVLALRNCTALLAAGTAAKDARGIVAVSLARAALGSEGKGGAK